ncbi:MAG: prefoldin subunit beta [Candidatus Micrarchaeia archaeon]
MAEPLRNPDELQKQLTEFQETQRQLQFVTAQRQQLSLQVEELKMAEEELGKAEKGTIYRAVGPLLMETTKADANADLKGKKELFEMRITVLTKQEDKLRPRFDELRAILEKAIKENRLR